MTTYNVARLDPRTTVGALSGAQGDAVTDLDAGAFATLVNGLHDSLARRVPTERAAVARRVQPSPGILEALQRLLALPVVAAPREGGGASVGDGAGFRELVGSLRVAWEERAARTLGEAKLDALKKLLELDVPPLFEILDRSTMDENAHSAVLRWLLDPRTAPNVAPALLRALTAKLNDATAWQIAIDEGIRLRAISARRERTRRQETGNAEVAERDRVDLIISGPSFVFAIENKTGTSEHDDQTKTYWSWISEFNCLRAAVFLSPYGGSASCEDFRPISYLDLLGMTLEAIAAGHATEHERIVLAMYARTLFAGPLRSESSIVKGASL